MPFSFAARAPKNANPQASRLAKTPFYPSDLLPAKQSLPAALADIETRHEIEREQIEQWSGPEEAKQRFLAELEVAHQHRRDLYEQQWGELQRKAERP
jgi:hypothetical protein